MKREVHGITRTVAFCRAGMSIYGRKRKFRPRWSVRHWYLRHVTRLWSSFRPGEE